MVTKNQTAGQKAAETKAKNKAAAATAAPAEDTKATGKAAPVKVAKTAPKAPAAKAPEKTTPAKTAPKPKAAAPKPEAEAEGEDEGAETDTEGKSVGRKELADTIRTNLAVKGFGVSTKMAAEIVSAFEQSVQGHLALGENVNLPGFGKFKVSLRAGGERRNPRTSEMITVPDQWAASFKVGKSLKDAIQTRPTA